MEDAEAMVALESDLGRALLELADPADALKSSAQLRRTFPAASPALIAAALTQRGLAERAKVRFGPRAEHYLWTSDGLAQASRPAASDYRAARLRDLGVSILADLTCGLGTDAIAFAGAGIDVVGVDRDPGVAELARINTRRANLLPRIAILTGDCTDPAILEQLPTQAWFIDPARRDPDAAKRNDGSSRRIDKPDLWSPPWSWVREQARRADILVAKAAPGIAHEELVGTATEWLSHRGTLLEACVWWGVTGSVRSAVLLDDAGNALLRVEAAEPGAATAQSCRLPEIGDLLLEPDPAIVRAGVVAEFGAAVGADLLDEHLAFLTARPEALRPAGWRGARVLEVLWWGEYAPAELSRVAREHGITRVDVVSRGRTLSETRVRRELKLPGGSGTAGTLVVAGLGEQRRTAVALTRPGTAPAEDGR